MAQPADNTNAPSKNPARSDSAQNLTDELVHRVESYRELIDFARAIVWRADAKTFQFTFVSNYAETLLGYPLQSWTDEPAFWKEHIHPEDREWAVALCTQATTGKEAHELEYRMIAADGRVIWLRDIVRVVVEDDRPKELVGVMVDITEMKNAEETVRQSDARIRQIVDTIPVEIWSGLPDGTIDFVNERWRSDLGLTLQDLPGDGWQKMIHPDERARVVEAWTKSVRTGIPYEQEERHLQANGQYRWVLSRGLPLHDEHGNIVRWFGTNTDIDDQKRAEEELRNSERRWRAIFENSSVGVALLDASLHYLTVNSAFEHIMGYASDELRSRTCVEMTVEEDRLHYKVLIDELLQGKRDRFEVEKRFRRKDGNLLWTHTSGSVVAGTRGESRLWVTIVKDITERKRLRDQLERERDRLRLLLDLNNKFVSKLNIRDFFDALAATLHDLEGWEYSFVALPESGDDLKVHLVGDSTGELKLGTNVPIEGTVAGNVYRTGQTQFFRVADLPPVPHYSELTSWREFARAEGLQAGCNLPLLYDEKVLGVLGFHTRNDMESDREGLGFLEELAKLVAVALHNALRYGELSESHEKLIHEKNYIEEQIRVEFGLETIIGRSKELTDVLKQVDAVAPTDSTVLILGETGTGKELIARAIHDRSSRRSRSLIKVDCSAIPGSLMESELFGHEKGAFTGALTQKLGRVEAADGGTLFLDEIGDVPLELQMKLLRVLQDQAFERLGSNRTRHLDVRIVAATNRDLEKMVANGEFREDLYYRLKVFPIMIPPLRERPDDIAPLVWHYVHKHARRMRKQIDKIPAAAMKVFSQYPWPGNVRELQHFMERSVILTSGDTLQAPLQELEQIIHGRQSRPAEAGRTMEQIERESILHALRASNWVVGGPHGAAAKLGLKRTTLTSRMERLRISRPK
jgi:formate hydrogenlyase transcriptional activator